MVPLQHDEEPGYSKKVSGFSSLKTFTNDNALVINQPGFTILITTCGLIKDTDDHHAPKINSNPSAAGSSWKGGADFAPT